MQTRQWYIDENNRSARVFAGSAGTTDLYRLIVTFDVLTKNANNEFVKTNKSLQYEFEYDDVEDKYTSIDQLGAIYATIENNVFTLHHHVHSMSLSTTEYFMQDNGNLIRISGVTPQIEVNEEPYYAAENGICKEYRHSKFVDEECNISNDANKCTYATDENAIRQYLLQHLSILKHDLWYNYEYGLPLLQKGLTKAMIDADVALIISECPNIDYIISFDSSIDAHHDYHLSFSVMTKYGKLDMIDTL